MAKAKRNKGGRPKGSPNKMTKVAAILNKLKFEPIKELVEMAQNPATSDRIRADILMKITEYVHPKQKAQESGADKGQPVRFVMNLGQAPEQGEQ